MKYFKLFFIAILFALTLCVNCAGPLRNTTFQVGHGVTSKLRTIKSICFGQITCQDTIITKAIKNAIIQEFLPSDIKISKDSLADAKIDITVTAISDMAIGGGSSVTRTFGVSTFSGSAGGYISGITAQIIQSGDIIASITTTQTRTSSWVPETPEEMSLYLAQKIICILHDDTNKCADIREKHWVFSFLPGIGYSNYQQAYGFSGSIGVGNYNTGVIGIGYDGSTNNSHSINLDYSYFFDISRAINLGPTIGAGFAGGSYDVQYYAFNILLGGFSQFKVNKVMSLLLQYHCNVFVGGRTNGHQSVSCGIMITL